MLRTTAWILLTAVAAIAPPAIAEPPLAGKDCRLNRYASVDLKLVEDEILIPVTIENKPALMFLNTSSAATVIWLPSAREFGLTPRNLPGNAQVYFGKQCTGLMSILRISRPITMPTVAPALITARWRSRPPG
jgi:hypothetical protein